MKKLLFSSLIPLFLLAGCKPETPAPKSLPPGVQSYEVRGIVREIAPDRREASIQHEAIPGFMGAMTMDFTVKNPDDLKNIAVSDQITFKLLVTETDSWIESVRFVAHVIENVTNNVIVIRSSVPELRPGDVMPDFTFTDETDRPVKFSDYRGRVLAFTFIFTRCPLPDFCPRMDLNFFEARALLLSTADAPTNWNLLTISFDPEFDLPEKLANYATYYRQGNADRWLFAVADNDSLSRLAPALDLKIARENDSISHNLRTVVIDPQGRIARQFDGNKWTPKELVEAMLAAARPPTNSTPQ